LALAYLSDRLTEQEYLDQRFKQNRGTGKLTKSALVNAKLFCTDSLKHELPFVMEEMAAEIKKTQQLNIACTFLQRFATWMSEPHLELKMSPSAMINYTPVCIAKDVDTIKGYIIQLRIYMKKVGGIPINAEDLKDYRISYPEPKDKEEVEPLLLEEFKIICGAQRNFRRQMLYRIMKDCEARIGAMVQLRKKHFDTTVRPISVTFPKSIMKKKNGISYTNVKYVITEDEEPLLKLLENYNDEDLVFGNNEDPYYAVHNEERAWSVVVNRYDVKLGKRYAHSGRLKKSIHSIKALTFTAAVEAVNETYAHAYGDHSRYTKTYLRWTKEQKILKFRLLESHISIYTQIKKIDNPEIVLENQMLKEKITSYDKQFLELSEKVKNQTKIIPDDEKVQRVLKLLEANKISI